jgi:hypothetical protein
MAAVGVLQALVADPLMRFLQSMRARRSLHLEDTMTNKDTRVITVHVPEQTFRKLKMVSATLDKTNAEIIIEAIDKLDVQVIEVTRPTKKSRGQASDTGNASWLDDLRPGPGEESIAEPWKPTSKDRQVEPDLSTASKGKRGGR